jgi:hypothetical protein
MYTLTATNLKASLATRNIPAKKMKILVKLIFRTKIVRFRFFDPVVRCVKTLSVTFFIVFFISTYKQPNKTRRILT